MKRYSDSVADNTLLVSQNVTNLMDDIRAEDLLNDAVYYIDARDASASGQTIDNLGTAKELLPTTLGSSTSADSNDPQYLSWSGTNYVYLPGVQGNHLSVPDSAALAITGDIDVRVEAQLNDWTSSTASLIVKDNNATSATSWYFLSRADSTLRFAWSPTGSPAGLILATSTSHGISNGERKWVRATLDVDNGAGGYTVRFFKSDDGSTWTQIGSDITGASTTSIAITNAGLNIGQWAGGYFQNGTIYRTQVLSGIDGTKVLDVDTSVLKTGAETSFTALTGQTVTINRSTSGRKTVAVTQPCWLFGTDDYMEVNNRYMSSGTYLYLPGIASNYASTPDAAALDIAGDIDVRVKVALDDWTPSVQSGFMSKWTPTGNQRSWRFSVVSNGSLQAEWSADGTSSSIAHTSSAVAGISDGTTKWIRWTLDVDNGASGYDSKFWTSDDGINWTQLGTTQTGVATTSIFASTAILEIGTSLSGGTHSRGKFFRAQVFNGIDGTKVFDADFENKITSLEQASFTEASSNAATVTINRSGSTYRSAGITTAGYLYPGATNTFSASATDFLNFGAADSFTVLAVIRQWATPGNFQAYVMKGGNLATGNSGYLLFNNLTNSSLDMIVTDGVNQTGPTALAYTLGSLNILGSSRNVAADTISNLVNTSRNNITDPTTGSLSTYWPLTIGKNSNASSGYATIELTAAAIFRRALTSSEITLITNYFNRRSL